VMVELAGVNREEIEVTVDRDTLTLRGSRGNTRSGQARQRYYIMEINVGPFERTLDLPVKVNTEGVTAEYDNGFLRVTLPKAMDGEPQRITIRPER